MVMLTLKIRTKKSGGSASLFTKMRVSEKVIWVNLKMNVDIAKWNEVCKSNIKIKNYLNLLGYYRKIQEIEFALQDLRLQNKLTKENIESAVQDIVLADVRAKVEKAKKLAENVEKQRKNNIKLNRNNKSRYQTSRDLYFF